MNQKLWWYTTRASGFVAWALVVASVLWGLLLSARATRPLRPTWVLDLHRFPGGLACAFVVLHLASLLADSYVGFDLADLAVPYASHWQPGAVAWGVVACYLLAVIEVTSLSMRHLPRRVWHAIHLLAFLAFVAVTTHALLAGSDASSAPAQWFAVGSTAAVVTLVTVRTRSLVRRHRVPTRGPSPDPIALGADLAPTADS